MIHQKDYQDEDEMKKMKIKLIIIHQKDYHDEEELKKMKRKLMRIHQKDNKMTTR
jgi:hypothetical protein